MYIHLVDRKYHIRVLCFLLKSPVSPASATSSNGSASQPLHKRHAGRKHRPFDLASRPRASKHKRHGASNATRDCLRPSASSSYLKRQQRVPDYQYFTQQHRTASANTTPPRSRHDLHTRHLSPIRLACDSYAPHPSPGIPHEQPQHVFC
jgi:hypothetical protein